MARLSELMKNSAVPGTIGSSEPVGQGQTLSQMMGYSKRQTDAIGQLNQYREARRDKYIRDFVTNAMAEKRRKEEARRRLPDDNSLAYQMQRDRTASHLNNHPSEENRGGSFGSGRAGVVGNRENNMRALQEQYWQLASAPDNPLAAAIYHATNGYKPNRGSNVLKGSGMDYEGSMISAIGALAQSVGNVPAQQNEPKSFLDQWAAAVSGMHDNPAVFGINQIRSSKETADAAMELGQTLRDYGAERSKSGQELVQAQKEGLGTVGKTMVDVGSGGIQMALDIGIGALTGLGMAAPMALRVFGSSVEEAAEGGATLNQQLAYGLGSAALSYSLEHISNVALSGLKVVAPGIGDDVAEAVIDKLAQKLAKTPKGATALKVVGSMLVSAGGEGFEEAMESFLQPYLKKLTYDENAKSAIEDPSQWADILYDGLLGAILGVTGYGVNTAVNTGGSSGASEDIKSTYERYQGIFTDEAVNKAYDAMRENGMFSREGREAISDARRKVDRFLPQKAAVNAPESVSVPGNIQTRVQGEKPDTAQEAEKAAAILDKDTPEARQQRGIEAAMRAIRQNEAEKRAAEEAKKEEITPAQKAAFDGLFGRKKKPASEVDTGKKTESADSATMGQQIEEAYASGEMTEAEYDDAMDALMEQESLEGINTLNRYNPEMMKEEVIDNGRSSVSDDGSQWAAGESAGEQAGQLAEGTGRDQSRTVQSQRARDRSDRVVRIYESEGQKPVTARNYLGSPKVEDAGEIYDVPQSVIDSDEELSEIVADIRGRGLVPHLYTGEARLSNGAVADAMIRDGHVYIRVDSPEFTATQNWEHEKFHGIIGKSREMLEDLFVRMTEKVTPEKLRQTIQRYREAYRGIVDVDANGNPITGEQLIYNVVEEILADAYAGKDTYNQNVEQFGEISQDAASQIEESGGEIRGPPEGRTAIETLPDGKKYVRADRQVIFGNDPESWSEQLENYINGKIRKGENVQLIADDGDVLMLTRDTAGKMSDNHTSHGTTMDDGEFYKKANAAAHIDELVQISRQKPGNGKADYDARHGSMASNGWRYRKAFFRDFDGKYYRVAISVAVGKDGSIVYNIGDMQERSFPTVIGSSAESGAQGEKASLSKSVPQGKQSVKGRESFSASEAPTTDAEQDPVQALPKKAQRVLEREEGKLTSALGNALRIPFKNRGEQLQGIAREITNEFLQTGNVSEKTLDDLFERAYRPSEQKLAEELGVDVEEYRAQIENDFKASANDLIAQLRLANRYAADQQADGQHAEKPVPTLEDLPKLYADMKAARRTAEKAVARNLLTESDSAKVNRLLRGDIDETMLNPLTDNVKGILEVFRAKAEYEKFAREIRRWNAQRKADLYALADKLLETAGDWKDKAAGILYSRETMERNIRDIVKDKKVAEEVINTLFKPVHDAAAKANKMKNEYRDRVRALKLSREVAKGNKISEAAAVQLLGEAEDNIRYLQSNKFIKERDGKTLEDWSGIVRDLWESNPNLDAAKIRNAVNEFRQIYDELFEQMNDARMRNGYEPINYRKGYFPHFQSDSGDGILAQFGRSLGINTAAMQLPTTINGMTHSFKPGIQWFGSAQQRQGVNTSFDAVEGFDSYIEGVADVIHQTDNIQRLRAFATQVRYRTSDEGLRKQVDAVRNDPTIAEEDKQNRIKEIYENGKFELGNFAVELDEYTNLLAGKKSRHDRDMEQKLGRRSYAIMKALESRVAANMVAINPGSWLTNFIPITQGAATLDSRSLLTGMWDTLRAYRQDDGMVARSSFLTNRRGSDPLVRTWAQETSAKMSAPMELIDSFTADTLVRARYNQNIRRGMSEDAAMADADQWAAGVMADRSKGAMPTVFSQTNPLTKLLTQFQLEVNNQLSFALKDIPRELRDKGVAALAMALLKFMLGAYLYNEVYEKFIGRRPALDPLGIINDTVGDLTGYELGNLLDDGFKIVEVEKKGLYDAGLNLATSVAEELPFVGGLMGGGRLPISSALPDVGKLWQAMSDDDWDDRKRLATAAKELAKPVSYIAPPFGGGQVKKIVEGAGAVIRGGSYSVDSTGADILQYPVQNDTWEQSINNAIRAALFGKSSLPAAQDWVESGFDSLSAKQTALFDSLRNSGASTDDAYSLIRDLEIAETTLDKISQIAKAPVMEPLKILGMSNALTESQFERFQAASKAGVTTADYAEVMRAIEQSKQARGSKSTGQADVKVALEKSNLTRKQKRAIWESYGWKTESPW